MTAFLDTSILVAAFYDDHEHHGPSRSILLAHANKQSCVAAHSLAEFYSVVTGRTGKHRVNPDEAMIFIESLRENFTVVALDIDEYVHALENAASLGIAGGGVYDAVLAHTALTAKAKSIFTWNVKHFMRLGAEIAARVKTP